MNTCAGREEGLAYQNFFQLLPDLREQRFIFLGKSRFSFSWCREMATRSLF